jgi:hypothetical protein
MKERGKGEGYMDPITMAIVAALAALGTGVVSGVTEVGKQAIVDGYGLLKGLLKRKFGDESEVVKSVERLETKPDSTGRQGMLQEELEAVKAAQDADIMQAAQALLKQIDAQPGGGQIIQHVVGNYNAVSGSGNATVNVNQPEKP